MENLPEQHPFCFNLMCKALWDNWMHVIDTCSTKSGKTKHILQAGVTVHGQMKRVTQTHD